MRVRLFHLRKCTCSSIRSEVTPRASLWMWQLRCFLKVQPRNPTPTQVFLGVIASNTYNERQNTSSTYQNLFMDTISPRTHLRSFWRCLALLPYFSTSHVRNSAFTPCDGSRSSPVEFCKHCELTVNSPSPAKPISPPDGAAGESYCCYVDFQNRI